MSGIKTKFDEDQFFTQYLQVDGKVILQCQMGVASWNRVTEIFRLLVYSQFIASHYSLLEQFKQVDLYMIMKGLFVVVMIV